MRAAITRNQRLVIDEMPAPTPIAGQLLCKTLVCGICGSDLHALDHYDHMIDVSARLGSPGYMKKGQDTVFGHEFCCEVIERGPQTQGLLKPGDRVVSVPGVINAEGMFEGIGYSSRIPGGFAQNIVLNEMMALKVPNGLSSEHAALTEPLAVGEHAVVKSGVEKDHVCMVIGCGPVGLAVIAALKMRGHGPVVAVDYSAERRAAAEIQGADIIIDPAERAPHSGWSEWGVALTQAEQLFTPAASQKRPLVFECVGAPGILQGLAEAVPRGTRIVVAGVCMEPDSMMQLAFISKEIELRYVLGYSPEEFAQSLHNLAEGRTPYTQIISDVVSLENTPEAFVRLQTDKSALKILVSPNS
jgi:threonine dehydrogenase-like Zn-dependent dehydrogenase